MCGEHPARLNIADLTVGQSEQLGEHLRRVLAQPRRRPFRDAPRAAEMEWASCHGERHAEPRLVVERSDGLHVRVGGDLVDVVGLGPNDTEAIKRLPSQCSQNTPMGVS